MRRPATFLGSSIGKKVVMAATGVVLFGFVVGHMLGNLQVYLGAEALNAYGEALRHILHGTGLWIVRGGLLLAVGGHIWAAAALSRANFAARPLGYRRFEPRESTYASRTMVWSGPILLLFILFHLAHLTTGGAHPDFIEGDVFHNLVVGFMNPWASGFYVIAMVALGLHLYHGVWSMLQTLGLSHDRWNPLRRVVAGAFAALVVAGNVSIPVAVLTGYVHL